MEYDDTPLPREIREFEHLEQLKRMQTLPHIHDIKTVSNPGALTIQDRGQITRAGTASYRLVSSAETVACHRQTGRRLRPPGSRSKAVLVALAARPPCYGQKRLPEHMLKGDAREIVHLLNSASETRQTAPVWRGLRVTRFEPLEPRRPSSRIPDHLSQSDLPARRAH